MSLNKSLFILLLALTLISSADKRQTTCMLYKGRQEVLKGRVKRFIQNGFDLLGYAGWTNYSDTISFNRMGEQTSERSGRGDGWYYQIDFNFSYEGGRKSLELPYPRAVGKREYEFDNDGRLAEASYYNMYGFLEKNTFSYNSAGQLTEMNWYDKKGVLKHQERLSYKDGLVVGEGLLTLYKYLAFDKHGNWIKRVSVAKDIKSEETIYPDTVVRKISYF